MPRSNRIQARAPAPVPNYLELFGFTPSAPRKRRRTVKTYQDPDTDSDEDVVCVGSREIQRRQSIVPTFPPTPTSPSPKITLGDEDQTIDIRPAKRYSPAEDEDEAKVAVAVEVQHVEDVDVVEGEAEVEGRSVFRTLPAEVHQNIVGFFENDYDVRTYSHLCKESRAAVSSSVWRKRFAETFDMPEGDFETLALAQKYGYRRDVSPWTQFYFSRYGAESRAEKASQRASREKCLLVMKDLILESNARKEVDTDGNAIVVGLNHEYIRKWVKPGASKYTDIIDAVLNTDMTSWDRRAVVSAATDHSLILVIQLCLTYHSLHPDSSATTVSHFDTSQKEAYTDRSKQPIFLGHWKQEINVRWLVYTVNFFKFHLRTSGGEGVLAQHYEELESTQYPQPWIGRLKDGTQPLGSHWKSAYTSMKDHKTLRNLRLREDDEEPLVDDGEMLSDLTIFFDETKFPSNRWPIELDTLLQSNPYDNSSPPRARRTRVSNIGPSRKYDIKTFFGTSRGDREAHFFGRIHGLPPQQGIPGFQRISMIKFYPNQGVYDAGQVWAYEGCVLPGNQIIVGRWWDLSVGHSNAVDVFGGPFIWWNVSESTASPPISPDEAMEFLDSVFDPNIGWI